MKRVFRAQICYYLKTKLIWKLNSQGENLNLNILAENSKIDFKNDEPTQYYDLTSNQKEGLNKPQGLLRFHNFITLGKISEKDKVKIIKIGFQLQEYNIKYKTIRRTKLDQSLKE